MLTKSELESISLFNFAQRGIIYPSNIRIEIIGHKPALLQTTNIDPEGFYEALGVNPVSLNGMTNREIGEILGKTRRKLALLHHPDLGGEKAAMERINEAYLFLRDPSNRRSYGK